VQRLSIWTIPAMPWARAFTMSAEISRWTCFRSSRRHRRSSGEEQLAAWEEYLKREDSAEARMWRLCPRDFWLTAE